MTNYRITIDMKDMGEGDATDLAQSIQDEWGEAYDPGDLVITISRQENPAGTAGFTGFDIGWEPR